MYPLAGADAAGKVALARRGAHALLALATANGGRLATLDQSIPIDAVRNAGARNFTLI
jgi:hypothetical protein